MRLIALLLAAPLAAQAPAKPAFNPQAFFLQSCAGCHGQDGSATRPDGKKGRAADLTDAGWQKGNTDAQIAASILNGKGHMPAFKGRLSEADALTLTTEVVRKLQKGTPVK
jgi:mono/diheme cytochrome c family protein